MGARSSYTYSSRNIGSERFWPWSSEKPRAILMILSYSPSVGALYPSARSFRQILPSTCRLPHLIRTNLSTDSHIIARRKPTKTLHSRLTWSGPAMSRRHTTQTPKSSTSTTVSPPTPSTSASGANGHDHKSEHEHDHDHSHGGLFNNHAHDHSGGAEQIITAFRSGNVDRGTRITLLGPLAKSTPLPHALTLK